MAERAKAFDLCPEMRPESRVQIPTKSLVSSRFFLPCRSEKYTHRQWTQPLHAAVRTLVKPHPSGSVYSAGKAPKKSIGTVFRLDMSVAEQITRKPCTPKNSTFVSFPTASNCWKMDFDEWRGGVVNVQDCDSFLALFFVESTCCMSRAPTTSSMKIWLPRSRLVWRHSMLQNNAAQTNIVPIAPIHIWLCFWHGDSLKTIM